MKDPHPLQRAMHDGAVDPLDARGLMPLEDARALVKAHSAFRKGKTTIVHGRAVLDGDRLWAALLSLADATEFVREATRLHWYFHPRGRDNVDAVARYGAAIAPWLESFIRDDGLLVNVPWCIVPCLGHVGGAALFEKLWRVRTVFDVADRPGPGPFAADSPGDVDALGIAPPPVPASPDASANALVIGWIWQEPAGRFPLLAAKARERDARAAIMLKSLAQTAPSEVFGYVSAALGEAEAATIFEACGAPRALDETAILASLDAASAIPGVWPTFFESNPELAYLAMRVVALRERAGDGWVVAMERAEGCRSDDARTRTFVYGSVVGPGWLDDAIEPLGIFEDLDGRDAPDPHSVDLDGTTVVGPKGPIALSNADHEALDLRAAWMTAPYVSEPRFSVLARAYLAKRRDAVFREPSDVAAALGLAPDEWEVIVVALAMHHVVGAAAPPAPYDDAALRVRPSSVESYRSLARAIAVRDPAAFAPGTDNLDFRDHARIAVGATG
jgi:hypothetical protein